MFHFAESHGGFLWPLYSKKTWTKQTKNLEGLMNNKHHERRCNLNILVQSEYTYVKFWIMYSIFLSPSSNCDISQFCLPEWILFYFSSGLHFSLPLTLKREFVSLNEVAWKESSVICWYQLQWGINELDTSLTGLQNDTHAPHVC